MLAIIGLIVNDQRSKSEAARRRSTFEQENAERAGNLAATGEDNALETQNSAAPQTLAATLETHLDDRTITKEQKSKFISVLRDAPKGNVIVSAVKDNREVHLYATKLASLLREAGFEGVDRPVSFLPETEPPSISGVLLFVSSQVPIRRHALAIKDAFEIIGIRCEFSYRETFGHPGDLQIAVYAKR